MAITCSEKKTIEFIKEMREKSGLGLMDVKRAVEKCGEDELLVLGFLKYYGCAVYIKGGQKAYDEWVMTNAHQFKNEELHKRRVKPTWRRHLFRKQTSESLRGSTPLPSAIKLEEQADWLTAAAWKVVERKPCRFDSCLLRHFVIY